MDSERPRERGADTDVDAAEEVAGSAAANVSSAVDDDDDDDDDDEAVVEDAFAASSAGARVGALSAPDTLATSESASAVERGASIDGNASSSATFASLSSTDDGMAENESTFCVVDARRSTLGLSLSAAAFSATGAVAAAFQKESPAPDALAS